MKKIILIIFITSFFNLYGQDQEATLFFNDGTSLEGYASIKDNWIIKFRLTLDDKPDEWKDIMVKGVTFHGFDTEVKYEYQYVKADKSFPLLLVVLEEGNVNLYKTGDYYTTVREELHPNDDRFGGYVDRVYKNNKVKFYIKKPNEDLIIKFNNGFYYKKAKQYFKDCPSLVEKIENSKFNKSKILEFIYYYNDLCDDEILEFDED